MHICSTSYNHSFYPNSPIIFWTLDSRVQPIKFFKKRSKKVIPTIPEKWKKEFASLAVVIAFFILTNISLSSYFINLFGSYINFAP